MSNYKKIMSVKEFMAILEDITKNYKTAYVFGSLGNKVTNDLIDTKAKQLPNWYTKERISNLKALSGKNYYGFDCVNLGKAILWGWNKGTGMKYATNTVPDVNADKMITLCENISSDMKNIMIGELCWFKGHVGYYAGKINGVDYIYECAPSLNKVALVKMSYQGKWTKHGKLPWLSDYKKETVDTLPLMIAEANSKLACKRGDKGETVKLIQKHLITLGYDLGSYGADGSFGNQTEVSIKQFQKKHGIAESGIVDIFTWAKLCAK